MYLTTGSTLKEIIGPRGLDSFSFEKTHFREACFTKKKPSYELAEGLPLEVSPFP